MKIDKKIENDVEDLQVFIKNILNAKSFNEYKEKYPKTTFDENKFYYLKLNVAKIFNSACDKTNKKLEDGSLKNEDVKIDYESWKN